MANGDVVPAPVTSPTGMIDDVQKGLAWFIVIAFVVLIFVWVFKPPVMAPESMAQLNQLVSTLQNILLLAVGFFFGSSKLAQNKDEVSARVAEKLADKTPPPSPVPPPVIPTVVLEPWWSKLTPEEREAVAASPDPRVKAFVLTAATGNGTLDDLAYLVSLGLLTQDRATAIQST